MSAAVISRIIGGLGNQMFQYAAARALSARIKTPVKLDITEFDHYTIHQGFELQKVFNGPFEVATDDEISNILGWCHPKIIRRVLLRNSFSALLGKKIVIEPQFDYWSGIECLTSSCYLSGYWQSERYFKDYETDIRNCYSFKTDLNGENKEWMQKISAASSVSLHIRRGDYVSNVVTSSVHGTCDLEYYQAAIRLITSRVKTPEFFIFSDDIHWAMQNLKIMHGCHYISNNSGESSHVDMRLMSLCKHHIIANSSFSWWGAWLNGRPDKIVVGPSQWFKNRPFPKDIYPSAWITL